MLFVREMSEADISSEVGEDGAAIDRITIAEFETYQELNEWLRQYAPAFWQPAE